MAAAGDGGESHCRDALREAFGDSSGSDSDTPAGVSPGAGRGHWRWEAVAGVRGLWLCAAFLSADEQARLLNAIQQEGWFVDANNQAMRFGDLPSWAVELSALIREAICVGDASVGLDAEVTNEDEDACPLPSDLLWREPFFDQMIANRYRPVSLESACVMHFSQAEPTSGSAGSDTLKQGGGESSKVPVLLNPGSLVLMFGDARYLWKHEIDRKPGRQLWDGRELEQHRRTSITLRKLLPCTD
ncbi:unnamed protein product [Miscanthus lutarioriparius]|uniref:Fe2OG dioxygenase domain-containing protein n=1 Tax=Miscanthus lutarioriparius TaxID=422564 RepID=A0A811PXE6_9POAL|nr:unnamed protein product [Miscanthus lutarioriparius]